MRRGERAAAVGVQHRDLLAGHPGRDQHRQDGVNGLRGDVRGDQFRVAVRGRPGQNDVIDS